MRFRTPFCLTVLFMTCVMTRGASGQSFADFDQNRDGAIQQTEFLARAGHQSGLWQRDFGLCDWNRDGQLTAAEFAACPALFPADQRGPWPDAIDATLERYLHLFDEHWERWDQNRNGRLSQGEFISGTLALSIPPLKTAAVKGCDPDGNGEVTRDEARNVLARLLGCRSWNDLPLRRPNGQVVDLVKFRRLDTDGSGALSASEMRAAPAETLSALDEDKDGQVQFVEWCQATRLSLADPIDDFRRLDLNRDGQLDSDELHAVEPNFRHLPVKFLLPGFDLDLDGMLSLAEFRGSPLGNPVLSWPRELADGNCDGLLTFDEFQLDGGQFRLLAWEYFHRFDWNGDLALDTSELAFHTKQSDAIYSIREDGTEWRRILHQPGYRDLEWVTVSPDGQQLAFVRWKYERAQLATASELCLCDLRSRSVRKLSAAYAPSWSPDGSEIACSRRVDRNHNWLLVQMDGTEREHAVPTGEWSPDGARIASVSPRALLIVNVDTSRSTTILSSDNAPFATIHERVCWSPDGEWLCLRGQTPDKSQQIVTVHAAGPELGFRIHDTMPQSRGGIAWHPRGDRVVFAKVCDEGGRMQLYEFDPHRADPPRLFPGQDPNRNNTDACWTPDGTTLFVVSGDY